MHRTFKAAVEALDFDGVSDFFTEDIPLREELIPNGCHIGMDRFGIDALLSTEDGVNTVATMCERGHADKMVLSHDASCYGDALPEHMLPVMLPNRHHLHINDEVIPALNAHGVTDDQVNTWWNRPRKILSVKGGY